VRQRELPSWNVRQVEPEGQAEAAQSWVQVPAVQVVPLLLETSGMHRLPWQPALRVQGEPSGWGVGLGAVQAPVLESQVSEEPQDQPRRQSGRQTLASGEHT
jgi:hypothetical protein